MTTSVLVGWLSLVKASSAQDHAAKGAPPNQPVSNQPVFKKPALERARAAAAALVALYDYDTGLFKTAGWWNSANAITALADEAKVTGDGTARSLFADSLERAPQKFAGFRNDFYDDEGWWALAWMAVYDLDPHAPQSRAYLLVSERIFADMTGGWDDTCGGGIWWKKDRQYKNAIANELFLSVAAHLAQRTEGKQRAQYLAWADREWQWFSRSGMINADHLVNDGLDASCHNNGKTAWSYNQGVVLGGLAALSQLVEPSQAPALLRPARQIASAAMAHLTDKQGILHDPCEPDCGDDGVQFKGIFTRNLAALQAVAGDGSFAHFLSVNSDSLWTAARGPGDRFGVVWSGPPMPGNAATQASALDALVAAAALSRP